MIRGTEKIIPDKWSTVRNSVFTFIKFRFPEFWKKYAWCGFSLNFMHKNCSIENV